MRTKKRKWPRSVQLPAGRIVSVKEAPAQAPTSSARARDGEAEAAVVFGDARRLFEGGGLELRTEDGERLEASSLALAEFHALRAIATHLGWLEEEPVEIECRNCGGLVEALPCASLPLGPFVDAELIDPDIDVTLDVDADHAIPAIAVGKGARATHIRLGPVTLERAKPLHQALARRELRVTSAVVRAMGIEALGRERDPRAIARALSGCGDAEFGAVTDLFLAAHYPPRLVAPIACPHCGTRNDVDAPYDREFEPAGAEEAGDAPSDFPSFDAFDAWAHATAEPLLADVPGPEIVLVIEGGVPACDDGGEPLMGSYVPAYEGGAHAPATPPELTLYYRTFAAMWRDDGPYDWKDEVRETIEHELEHHLHGLTGHDPKDEAERDEIEREAERIHGSKQLARARTRALAADLGDFWRRTWVFWVVGLIVVVISVLASR